MKKARLYITAFEYKFSCIYGCCPERMFDRLCLTMDSKKAAEYLNNNLIPHAWEIYEKEDREKQSLYKKGFYVSERKIRTPFDADS